jgi:hypothetical protein
MSEKKINVGAILFGVFCLLIVSICIALYLGATEERQESKPIKGQATVQEVADYLKKLNGQIGNADLKTPGGQLALRQTAAMIEGTLGPLNLGYEVSRSSDERAEGLLWTTLWIDAGDVENREVTLLAIPYGEGGTPVAFGLGLAEYLVLAKPKQRVRIVFYPPVFQQSLWERVEGDSEELVGQIDLLGGAGHNTWGNLYLPEAMRKVIQDPTWEKNLNVLDPKEGVLVELSEKGPMKTQQQADRLLRMMPVVKALLDGI